MFSLVVVLVKPELIFVSNTLKIFICLDIFPKELSFHGLMVTFDLSVVFRGVRRIHTEFYSIRYEMISRARKDLLLHLQKISP